MQLAPRTIDNTSAEGVNTRPVLQTDARFIGEMAYEAAFAVDPHSLPLKKVIDDPALKKISEGWGQAHDGGRIAESASDGRLLGAAWYRSAQTYRSEWAECISEIPFITMGVRPEARGRGIGKLLLREVMFEAARTGHPMLCLDVLEKNTKALSLYESHGFNKALKTWDETDEQFRYLMVVGLGAAE